MMTKKEIAALPLRERKKELIRQAILKSAEKLFELRGYDNVTVAEIADAADISVKTLFTYYRSKEDLLFQDSSLITAVIAALRERSEQTTAAEAIAGTLISLLKNSGAAAAESLAGFQRGYGESDALYSRILRLWAEYEEMIAHELMKESQLDRTTANIRFEAAQLVTLIRAFTWKELYELVLGDEKNSIDIVTTWLKEAVKQIDK